MERGIETHIYGLILIGLLVLLLSRTTKEQFNYYPVNDQVVEQKINPNIAAIIFREGCILGKPYICPGGVRTTGIGYTWKKITIHTFEEAMDSLQSQINVYKKVISKDCPHLTETQLTATVMWAMNFKWDTVRNSNTYKRLKEGKTPNFIQWCYYGNKKKSYNMLQSRLYEQALFESKKEITWVNPYRNYSNEKTTIGNVQQFYVDHYQERLKQY